MISRDTYEGDISNPLSINQYTYCYNNPLIFVDPSGNDPVGLRASVESSGGSIDWNSNTRTATATINGITRTYSPDTDLTITLDPATGRIMVDSDKFFNDFRNVSDNSSSSSSSSNDISILKASTITGVIKQVAIAGANFFQKLNDFGTALMMTNPIPDNTVFPTQYGTLPVGTFDNGFGMIVAGIGKIGGKITGYTSHGLMQAIGRDGGIGVSPSAILNAVKNPIRVIEQTGGRLKYVGENAVVVLNNAGRVITTWAKSTLGIRGGR